MKRKIDFVRLFEEKGLEYTTEGQHRAGNIGINCPFCQLDGNPDPSAHLGINLDTGAWNCWRSHAHRGWAPHRLLRALFGMSHNEVNLLIGSSVPQGDFDATFSKDDPFADEDPFVPRGLTEASRSELKAFVPLQSDLAAAHRQYLLDRGIYPEPPVSVRVRAGLVGKWCSRIIIPIWFDHLVVTWTARKISDKVEGPRYRTLRTATAHEGFGGCNIKNYLYDVDALVRHPTAETLIVVEGAMDAINLAQHTKSPVTCVFGTSMSSEQTALLWSIAKKFDRVAFMFDEGFFPQAIAASAGVENGEAIDIAALGVLDPGEVRYAHRPLLSDLRL